MPDDLSRMLIDSFLKSSGSCCVKVIVEKLANWNPNTAAKTTSFFRFKDDRRIDATYDGNHFFLRSSVEYSNPQLTVEEVQGVIGTRMLEACGNYFHMYGQTVRE